MAYDLLLTTKEQIIMHL